MNSLASKIVQHMVSAHVITDEQVELYQYGFELLISTIANFVWILVLGLLVDRFLIAVIYVLILATVRTQIGGYHASSYFKCFLLYNCGFACVNGLIAVCQRWKPDIIVVIVWMVLLLGLIVIFAPVTHTKEPDEKERKAAKRQGIVRSLIWTVIMMICWRINPVWSYSILMIMSLSVFFMLFELVLKKMAKAQGVECKNE